MLATVPLEVPLYIKKTSMSISSFHIFCCSCSSSSSRLSVENGSRFDFSSSSNTTKWPRARFFVRNAYIRKPLETAGAYQLIDEDTGEKVIVWGGIDDDAPIPSKEMLSYTKNRASKSNGEMRNKKKTSDVDSNGEGDESARTVEAVTRSDNITIRPKGLAGNFGKLKAHRVSTLVRKISRRIKEDNEDGYEKSSFEEYEDDNGKSSFKKSQDGYEKSSYKKDEDGYGKSSFKKSQDGFEKSNFRKSQDGYEKSSFKTSPDGYEKSNFKKNQDGYEKSSFKKFTPVNRSASLDLELEPQETGTGPVGQHRGSTSRVTPAKYVKDAIRYNETIGSTKHSAINPKRVAKKLSSDSVPSPKVRDSDIEGEERDVSASRTYTESSLRGWGSGVPVESSTYETTSFSKQARKMSADTGFFSRKSFKDVGCSDDMIEALKAQHFSRPSHIQAMSFSPVVEGKTCIIAEQSGSGKTLAYLSPVAQRLRQEEVQGLGKSASRSPRVVILVPTAELASQTLSICRSMSKSGIPFRSMVATGGFRQKTQLESLEQELDVVIATPGRFLFLLNEGFLKLTNLKCAVLDEVDILFGDEEFQQVLQTFVKSAPVTTQYLFVTATLPVDIYNKLVEFFPDSEVIMGPGVHRTSSRLEEVLVDCSGDYESERTPETAFVNKKSALLQIVERSPVSRTIIFCNKIETCRKVENVLNRFDRKGLRIKVLPFHSALAPELRATNMKEFLNIHSNEDSMFLICTDRASRGIDFASVDHVVLFDFPREPSEYVRRVGRTARGARDKGKAFVFVVGKQVSLAERIMDRNLKGHPLHDVPSTYGLDW